MKKVSAILMSVIMLVNCFAAFPISAYAGAVNTVQTAKTVTLGTTKTTFKYGYPNGDYKTYVSENEIYFKFVPTYTGYYEFRATGYEKTKYTQGNTASVSITVKDGDGNSVGSVCTNEYNLLTKKAFQLTKGKKYIINLYDYMGSISSYRDNDYGYAEQTISLKISEHSHTLVTENYSSFNYVSCKYCDYSYYDYNVGTVKSVTLGKTSFVYNGKVQTPSVVAKDTNGKRISSSAYKVTISGNKKSVGVYTVTVQFGSGYKNAKRKLTYKIIPKSTGITKLTAGKKKFTVKWKKQASQTTGYQIQYSTSSKFKKPKTVTVSKNSTTSKSISKLSAKKKYYVRVRTYKTVKVNGKNTKIYSSWSKAKTVTTKK